MLMESIDTLTTEITEQSNLLRTERLDLSCGELLSMYENKEIIIRPAFQRYFRWTLEQQTKFIESLLLGIPIPPIFVAANDEGVWELVDGLQRVSTILSFVGILDLSTGIDVENKWELLEGDRVKSLCGYTYDKLPQRFRLALRHSVFRVEILKWNSNYDMRYELFNRLNTGGTPLTQQEIRNCIFRDISDDFYKSLKEWSELECFVTAVGLTKEQKERLFDQELILRFLTLLNGPSSIRYSVSREMTLFMWQALKNRNFDYNGYSMIIVRVFNVVKKLGSQVFRQSNGDFATSLYDVITYGIAHYIDKFENMSPEKIHNIIEKKVKQDDNLIRYSRRGGNNQRLRIVNRLKIAEQIFGHE